MARKKKSSAAAQLGATGGKAGKGAAKARGNAEYYRSLVAKRKDRALERAAGEDRAEDFRMTKQVPTEALANDFLDEICEGSPDRIACVQQFARWLDKRRAAEPPAELPPHCAFCGEPYGPHPKNPDAWLHECSKRGRYRVASARLRDA